MAIRATIYHNPRCGTSRQALALLSDAGVDVTIVEYLKSPPSTEELARLYKRAGLAPRDGLRKTEAGAEPLLDADDATVLAAMTAHPILIQRPLVETDKGVVLGRPPETIRRIL